MMTFVHIVNATVAICNSTTTVLQCKQYKYAVRIHIYIDMVGNPCKTVDPQKVYYTFKFTEKKFSMLL